MSEPVKISGIIITHNEEKNIERCIKSLMPVCEDILVVDSYSTDNTKKICLSLGARFLENQWTGFLNQKNFAQDQALHNIVLQLDADEEVSDELKTEILHVKQNWAFDGYLFNRFTNFCGKWIKHSGWYPDAKLRLYDRRKGSWQGLDPHPGVQMNDGSSIGKIKGDLLHYSFSSYEDFVIRNMGYAKQSALAMKAMNKRPSLSKMILSPVFRFFKDYILQGGYKDGIEGYLICRTNAYYTFLKYMYLRLINTGKSI